MFQELKLLLTSGEKGETYSGPVTEFISFYGTKQSRHLPFTNSVFSSTIF
jgi:hypothetical protein